MPESKSGALPLGDSPSKPVTISFCGKFAQGMAGNNACVNEPRTGCGLPIRVMLLGRTIVDPLQQLPRIALGRAGNPPRVGRRREAAIDDAVYRGSGTRHSRGAERRTTGGVEIDGVER